MYASANEAALLLRELARLGPTQVVLDAARLPLLDALDPEEAYLSWTVDLLGEVDDAAVRDVFDFVEGDCDLTIEPLAPNRPDADHLDDYVEVAPLEQIQGSSRDDLDIAALLARAGALIDPETTVSAPSLEEPQASPLLTGAVVDLSPQAAGAPIAAPTGGLSAATPAPVTIRVDLDRVDRLINVVGELVIQQAMLSQKVAESGLARSSGIALGLEDLELLTREIQDSVMAIRAQPVKSVFQRMPRLVRETAEM
ncbi:hypothetical protein LTR94_029035, partial [Friedmanniomyces endolithicus]